MNEPQVLLESDEATDCDVIVGVKEGRKERKCFLVVL